MVLAVALRHRPIIASVLMTVGVGFLAFSIAALMNQSRILDWVGILAGAILILLGIVIFVTELMERWLTRGQRALVDGLQAG